MLTPAAAAAAAEPPDVANLASVASVVPHGSTSYSNLLVNPGILHENPWQVMQRLCSVNRFKFQSLVQGADTTNELTWVSFGYNTQLKAWTHVCEYANPAADFKLRASI